MTPEQFLIFLFALTAGAAASEYLLERRSRKRLQAIAGALEMHYAPGDRLRLAARVAEQFSFPGAYDVRVRNLMFRTDHNRHEYLFTIEYGTGVVRGKRRRARVGGFAEPVTRAGLGQAQGCKLILGPKELAIAEQYRQVFRAMNGSGGADAIA